MASIEVMNVKQANPEAPIEIQLSTSNITYRGPKGDQGPAGRDGAVGSDGKSAYELAMDNGFEGTETEWLASLKGETGATGPAGAQGPAGQNGTTPVKGVDYFTEQDIADFIAEVPTPDLTNYVQMVSLSTTRDLTQDEIDVLTHIKDTLKARGVQADYGTSASVPYQFYINNEKVRYFRCNYNFVNESFGYEFYTDVYNDSSYVLKTPKYYAWTAGQARVAGGSSVSQFIDGFSTGTHMNPSAVKTTLNDSFQYIKDNYATKTYVEELLRGAEAGVLKRAVVQSLPTESIDDYTIYMVPKTGEPGDSYYEYLYIDNAWECLGSTEVDLTGYATEAYVNTAVGAISGGTTYTAGTGISISNNDEISLTQPANSTANMFFALLKNSIATTGLSNLQGVLWKAPSTKADCISALLQGYIVNAQGSFTITQSDLGLSTNIAVLDLWVARNNGTFITTSADVKTQHITTIGRFYFYSNGLLVEWRNPVDIWSQLPLYTPDNTFSTIGAYLKTLAGRVPAPSTTDGTYKLNCAVSSGSPTYSWTSDSGGGTTYTAGTGITISGTTISADSQLPAEPVDDGTYKLNCSISSGASTYSWATDSGGGNSYTAGDGISIDANNVISSSSMDKCILPIVFSLVDGSMSTMRTTDNIIRDINGSSATKTDFINAIQAGKLVAIIGEVPSWTGLGRDFASQGITYYCELSGSTSSIKLSQLSSNSNRNWRPQLSWIYWRSGSYLMGMPMTYDGSHNSLSRWLTYYNDVSGLSATTMQGAIDELAGKVPAPSTTDGTYVLQCVVSNGTPTYSWVSAL